MAFNTRVVEHACQHLCFIEISFIVYPQIAGAVFSTQFNYHRFKAIQADAFVLLCAKDQRLALLHEKCLLRFAAFFKEYFESAVVEYVTVLVDLQEGSAFVCMAAFQQLLQVLGITVHAAGNESSISAHSQCQRVERMVYTAKGSGFGYLILFGSRRVLSFR